MFDGTLSFLGRDANRELGLRIQRARESEDNRHVAEKGEVDSDWFNHGLPSCTARFQAVNEIEIKHLRELSRIAREEVFKLVRADRLRLRAGHIAEIAAFVAAPFHESRDRIVEQMNNGLRERGLHRGVGDLGLNKRLQDAEHQESVVAVQLAASEYGRERKAERRTWWRAQLGKAAWVVIPLALAGLTAWITGLVARLFRWWNGS